MFRPTPEQRAAMIDAGMSEPMRLSAFDNRPFVYDRQYGYFHVSPSKHGEAMAFLFDLHQGNDGTDYYENACQRFPKSSSPIQLCADEYLNTIRGTAFGSSVSRHTTSGFGGSLNPSEIRVFGDVRFIGE